MIVMYIVQSCLIIATFKTFPFYIVNTFYRLHIYENKSVKHSEILAIIIIG